MSEKTNIVLFPVNKARAKPGYYDAPKRASEEIYPEYAEQFIFPVAIAEQRYVKSPAGIMVDFPNLKNKEEPEKRLEGVVLDFPLGRTLDYSLSDSPRGLVFLGEDLSQKLEYEHQDCLDLVRYKIFNIVQENINQQVRERGYGPRNAFWHMLRFKLIEFMSEDDEGAGDPENTAHRMIDFISDIHLAANYEPVASQVYESSTVKEFLDRYLHFFEGQGEVIPVEDLKNLQQILDYNEMELEARVVPIGLFRVSKPPKTL